MSVDALVEETLNAAQALYKALTQEQQALESAQSSELETRLEEKQELIVQFQHCWDQLLLETKVDPGKGIYEQILRYCQTPQYLDKLIDMTKKCHHANQVNGTVVTYSLRRAKTALDILLGGEHNSYSASGQLETDYTKNSRKA